MAQKIQTTLIDDLDSDVEATGYVVFARDGATYEIDLSDKHTAELRAAVAPYVAGATRHVSSHSRPLPPPDAAAGDGHEVARAATRVACWR